MQGRDRLLSLMKRVKNAHLKLPVKNDTQRRPPLLIKIAPDLTEKDMEDIAYVARQVQVDGIIVSNTTVARPESLQSSHSHETGGLSGAPLFEKSTQCLRDLYRITKGELVLIGAGGVSNGRQAYAKIRAGASLVQLYSAFAYGGPPLVNQVKQELIECLKEDGFSNIAQAVGADVS